MYLVLELYVAVPRIVVGLLYHASQMVHARGTSLKAHDSCTTACKSEGCVSPAFLLRVPRGICLNLINPPRTILSFNTCTKRDIIESYESSKDTLSRGYFESSKDVLGFLTCTRSSSNM